MVVKITPPDVRGRLARTADHRGCRLASVSADQVLAAEKTCQILVVQIVPVWMTTIVGFSISGRRIKLPGIEGHQ